MKSKDMANPYAQLSLPGARRQSLTQMDQTESMPSDSRPVVQLWSTCNGSPPRLTITF